MEFRPPGNHASGPNPGTTNARGGLSVPIRSRGAGTYIILAHSTPNGGAVPVSQGAVGAIVNGRVAKKMPFGSTGSSGR
jgi:hypothetical protein